MWNSLEEVPSDVRVRQGAALTVDQANFWKSCFDLALSQGITTTEASEVAWTSFQSRFKVEGKSWVEVGGETGELAVNMGAVTHYQSLTMDDGIHLQMLCGSTGVDAYNTYIDPSIIPAFRMQATEGQTVLRHSHNRAHPFPLGVSTRTIPADQWELYSWPEIQQQVQVDQPDNVLIYDFLLNPKNPYHDMLCDELGKGTPFSASMGMLGVYPRRIRAYGSDRDVKALVGPNAHADHVALLFPGWGANPDANHGFVGATMGSSLQSLFDHVPIISGKGTTMPTSAEVSQAQQDRADRSTAAGAELFKEVYGYWVPDAMFGAQLEALSSSLRRTFWSHQESGADGMEAEVREILDAFAEVVISTVLTDTGLRSKEDLARYLGAQDRNITEEDNHMSKVAEFLAGLTDEEKAELQAALASPASAAAAEEASAAAPAAEVEATPAAEPAAAPAAPETPAPAAPAEPAAPVDQSKQIADAVAAGVTAGLDQLKQELAPLFADFTARMNVVEQSLRIKPIPGAAPNVPASGAPAGVADRTLAGAPIAAAKPIGEEFGAVEQAKGTLAAKEAGRSRIADAVTENLKGLL